MGDLLANPNITDIAIFTLIGLVLILAMLVVRLEFKLKKFLGGKKATTLEDTIVRLQKDVSSLNETRNAVNSYLEDVERRLKQSIQNVKTIRFNPFKGSGGGQSFTTAMLSEDGDGVVISTLHARDRISIFGKPITKFASEHELSEEEKEAIKRVRKEHE